MDFDFLNDTAEAEDKAGPLIPDVLEEGHGPNMTKMNKMTRKKFTQGVLNVYQQLGGDIWLLQQAAIDPKGFLDMMKKLIPTNMNIDQMEGFSITLVDRYGNRAEITPNDDSPRAVELGPKPSQDRANEQPGKGPDLAITETFPAPPNRLLSDNTLEVKDEGSFDFTV
jgi:hypothetical protein